MNQTKKRDPTDNNLNIITAPGHYEQKDLFTLYKSVDLQVRTVNLKSVENFKRNLNVIQLRLKNRALRICCLSLTVTGIS